MVHVYRNQRLIIFIMVCCEAMLACSGLSLRVGMLLRSKAQSQSLSSPSHVAGGCHLARGPRLHAQGNVGTGTGTSQSCRGRYGALSYGTGHGHSVPLAMSQSQSQSQAGDKGGNRSLKGPAKTNVKLSELASINLLYMRCSWVSWWIQVILSVISGVILTFANTVRVTGTSSRSLWSSGFSFSTLGVALAFVNTFWTWNITRLNRRIQFSKIDADRAVPTLRRYSRIAVGLSLVGMLLTLLGGEQIVGTLASKVLLTQSVSSPAFNYALSPSALQPLDIFLVQANTNTMVAHFAPLACYVSLQLPLSQIDTKATGNSAAGSDSESDSDNRSK